MALNHSMSFIYQVVFLLAFSSAAYAQQRAQTLCFKADRLISAHDLLEQLEISSFDRIFAQIVKQRNKTYLLMRAQLKTGTEFWTHSKTLLATRPIPGRFANVKVLPILSSPNVSQQQWKNSFYLVKNRQRFSLYYHNKTSPYSFQLAPPSECDTISLN